MNSGALWSILAREPLQGEVEVDDWVGGTQAGLRGSRQLQGRKSGADPGGGGEARPWHRPCSHGGHPDFKSTTLIAFLKRNEAPGATVYTDGLKSFAGLHEAGFKHVRRSQPLRIDLRRGPKPVAPLADRALGNLQQWLIGTYHGVSRDQLQACLDQFVFRRNRRRLPMAAFQTNPNLLGLAETTG